MLTFWDHVMALFYATLTTVALFAISAAIGFGFAYGLSVILP